MKKAQTIEQIQKLDESALKEYLIKKTQTMFAEYGVDSMDNIGYYVLLEANEMLDFDVKEMEFVEVLGLKKETYLHGVKILSDNYGEDIFLPVEVKKCLTFQELHSMQDSVPTISVQNP